jgi:hypothetical protein
VGAFGGLERTDLLAGFKSNAADAFEQLDL